MKIFDSWLDCLKKRRRKPAKPALGLFYSQDRSLLEDLALLESGATTKLSVPGEEVLNELLVLLILVIKLLPLVVGVVISLLHLIRNLQTAEQPDGRHLKLGLLTEDGEGTEAVLPEPVQALNEATEQVGSHEQLLALIVELVVADPEGITLRGEEVQRLRS